MKGKSQRNSRTGCAPDLVTTGFQAGGIDGALTQAVLTAFHLDSLMPDHPEIRIWDLCYSFTTRGLAAIAGRSGRLRASFSGRVYL